MARSVGSAALARSLGARVCALRQGVSLSQEQLALRANLSPGMVALVESGKRLPSLGALVALAGALGVDLVDLVAFDVGRNPLHVLVDAVRRGDVEGAQTALALLAAGRPRT